MKLLDIKQRISEKRDSQERDLPTPCKGCPNLKETVYKETGRKVISCLLETAASQKTGKRDKLAKDGPSARWLGRALLSDNLDDTEDRGAIAFREKAIVANDGCPIIEKVIDELLLTDAADLIDLTPPLGILPYSKLKLAIDLD